MAFLLETVDPSKIQLRFTPLNAAVNLDVQSSIIDRHVKAVNDFYTLRAIERVKRDNGSITVVPAPSAGVGLVPGKTCFQPRRWAGFCYTARGDESLNPSRWNSVASLAVKDGEASTHGVGFHHTATRVQQWVDKEAGGSVDLLFLGNESGLGVPQPPENRLVSGVRATAYLDMTVLTDGMVQGMTPRIPPVETAEDPGQSILKPKITRKVRRPVTLNTNAASNAKSVEASIAKTKVDENSGQSQAYYTAPKPSTQEADKSSNGFKDGKKGTTPTKKSKKGIIIPKEDNDGKPPSVKEPRKVLDDLREVNGHALPKTKEPQKSSEKDTGDLFGSLDEIHVNSSSVINLKSTQPSQYCSLLDHSDNDDGIDKARLASPTLVPTPIDPVSSQAFPPRPEMRNGCDSHVKEFQDLAEEGFIYPNLGPSSAFVRKYRQLAEREYHAYWPRENQASQADSSTVTSVVLTNAESAHEALRRILDLARYHNGKVALQIKLGKIMVRGLARQHTKAFAPGDWEKIFQEAATELPTFTEM